MANGIGLNWEQTFSKNWDDMSPEEKNMSSFVAFGMLFKQSKTNGDNIQRLAESIKQLPCERDNKRLLDIEDYVGKRKKIDSDTEVESLKGKNSQRVEVIKGVFYVFGAAIGGGAIVALITFLLTGKP